MQIFTTYNYNTNLNFQQRLSASARKAYEPKVVALYKQNIKPQEIVKILKVSEDFVRNVIQKYLLKRPTRIKQDEVNNMLDVISPEKIQEIFQCPISKANSIYSKVKENIKFYQFFYNHLGASNLYQAFKPRPGAKVKARGVLKRLSL